MRLFTKADLDARPEHETPEIRRLDLAQTMLDLAALGPGEIPWLEAPPEAHARAATELLLRLGAVTAGGALTEVGRSMLRFAVHPRAARVIVEGERRGVADDACLAAAILTEGDLRASARASFGSARGHDAATEPSDVGALVDLFREVEDARFRESALRAAGLDPSAVRAVARASDALARQARRGGGGDASADEALRRSLLAGYVDRVAKRLRAGGRAIALAGGGGAELAETSVVRDAEWMVALDAEERPHGARGGAVVRLASAIEPDWLLDVAPDEVIERREIGWDHAGERVVLREEMRWGGLVLDATERLRPSGEDVTRALATAALEAGAHAFAPEGTLARWVARVRFAASVDASIPAPADASVGAILTELCEGRSSFAELREAGLLDALRASLGKHAGDVDRLAPERIVLSGGRACVVRYDADGPPRIASRVKDFFGAREGPRVGGGRVPLVLELLAPNGRPQQVTTDLAGFWSKHYPSIRRELMRRYPRHAWPEDPTVKPASVR